MVRYIHRINNKNGSEYFTQRIQVGGHTLSFDFKWANISTEQFSLIVKYIKDKALNDPILRKDGVYDREYNWYDFYRTLKDVNLEEWLSTDPERPQSLHKGDQSSIIHSIQARIKEVDILVPIVSLYSETLRWQFSCVIDEMSKTVGYIEPGGWYRNQDSICSFKFVTGVPVITNENVNEVYIIFEVYDE